MNYRATIQEAIDLLEKSGAVDDELNDRFKKGLATDSEKEHAFEDLHGATYTAVGQAAGLLKDLLLQEGVAAEMHGAMVISLQADIDLLERSLVVEDVAVDQMVNGGSLDWILAHPNGATYPGAAWVVDSLKIWLDQDAVLTEDKKTLAEPEKNRS